MEWIETASVIVSTNPDVAPVMTMRKLKKFGQLKFTVKPKVHALAHPTCAIFLFPYALELPNELNSQLLLPQIGASLDNY